MILPHIPLATTRSILLCKELTVHYFYLQLHHKVLQYKSFTTVLKFCEIEAAIAIVMEQACTHANLLSNPSPQSSLVSFPDQLFNFRGVRE